MRTLFACVLTLGSMTAVSAASRAALSRFQSLDQSEFREASEDLAAALSFKLADPGGFSERDAPRRWSASIGFDSTAIRHASLLSRAAESERIPSWLPVATLGLSRSLPGQVDVAATLAWVPPTELNVAGVAASWAFLTGEGARPDVALHVAGTSVFGAEQLSLRTGSVELVASTAFARSPGLELRPYAAIGGQWARSRVGDVRALRDESFTQLRLRAGIDVDVSPVSLLLEADRTGDVGSLGLKLEWGF